MIEQCAKSIKSAKAEKVEKTMSDMNGNLFGKAIKDAVETKAVTTYASTEATQPLGIVTLATGLAAKCRKQVVKGNLNVVYSATNVDSDGKPVVAAVGELTDSATETELTQYDAIPGKYLATVAIPAEYLEDVPAMEAFVTQELNNQAQAKLDECILNGTFAGSKGLKGVCVSADTVFVDVADDTLPTLPELHAMVDSIVPSLQPNAVWVISPKVWGNLKAELLDMNNLNAQLISDGTNKTLLGYPVMVSIQALAATPVIFGDFSQYLLGMARDITIEIDRSNKFNVDAVVAKVTFRIAGGPACSLKVYDGETYGAFAVATENAPAS
jgi:HK97 family phage major capsid protein